MRRGSDSANARWGNTVAILVGDLLFARASDIVADLGPEFVQLQARTFSRLVQGQIAETRRAGRRAGPAGPLPAGGRRQDRLADRHLGAVRRQAVRRDARGAAGDGGVRRADRRGLPAQRRHHRHHQRRDRQDARAPTFARASPRCRRCWPASPPIPPTPACWSSSTPTCTTTTPWPRCWTCSAATAASTRPAPRSAAAPSGPAPSSSPFPPARPATPSRTSATPSSPAPPDPPPLTRPPFPLLCWVLALSSVSHAAWESSRCTQVGTWVQRKEPWVQWCSAAERPSSRGGDVQPA